ncbi:MAG: HAD family hydrolase [Catonella sp.]|uniref:HAD family hydrolase n=1 Tax=Catonella sp. TaxID=2382125 RepID=UPI003F9F7568
MYKNILFDMGNVIMDFSPDYLLSMYTKDVKLINFLKYKIVYTKAWGKSDKGELTEEGIYEEIIKDLDEKYHALAKEVIYTWYKYKTENSEMYELIKDLKNKGYKLFLCSNAAESFHKYEDSIEAFKLLDAKIVSADIKEVKPNREFFEYVLNTYKLKAEECFFIDDIAENIRGAYECGIDGYQYNGNVNLLRKFMKRVAIL